MTPEGIEDFLREMAGMHSARAVIVGKGPSFSDFDRDRFAGYFIVGLNETPLRTACHAGFVIDEDILLKHGGALIAAMKVALIVPRVMHHRSHSVGGLTIYWANHQQDMNAPWRHVAPEKVRAFNLSSAGEADASLGAVYPAFSFSAPTVANLLASCGFTDIVLCGVDGGSRYAGDFKSFEAKKLGSIQNDFDVQFAEFRRIRQEHGTRFSSVRCAEAHVLIGTEAEQCLATEVLRHSIDQHTFLDVRYADTALGTRELYADGKTGTPFSLQRLRLPQLSGHTGRGLYLDSDMLVFRDVYEVFNADMGDNVLLSCAPTPGREPQYSVFLVDNRRAGWDADELTRRLQQGAISYAALMHEFDFAQPKAAALPACWNSLESYEHGRTANLHYTDMSDQPWLSLVNSNASLWCEALFDALDASEPARDAYRRSLDAGWVRPSLRWQVDHRKADPWSTPRAARRLDEAWIPPHVRLQRSPLPPVLRRLRWRLAMQWRQAQKSRVVRRARLAQATLAKIFAGAR